MVQIRYRANQTSNGRELLWVIIPRVPIKKHTHTHTKGINKRPDNFSHQFTFREGLSYE